MPYIYHLDLCSCTICSRVGSQPTWDETLRAFVHRLDSGDATAKELVAGVALARRYETPWGRMVGSPWGYTVRDLVGSAESLFARIAAHAQADTSVWVTLLRAKRREANDALVSADRPHRDAAYRAAALRFRRLDARLLVRVAQHAHGREFERVARRIMQDAFRFGNRNAAPLLDQFGRACAPQIAAAPRTLWRPLLHVDDAGVRERGIRLAGMRRLGVASRHAVRVSHSSS